MKSNRRKGSRVAIVVLGMHRSGTSALTGTLTILGCDGPATPMTPTPDNSKGYFEPKPLYPLHTQLLESAASSWDDWLPINSSWLNSLRAEEFAAKATSLMEEQFGKSRLFVLKDPRICRLVPFWARVLGDLGVMPCYLLIHRNPLEVAQSLQQRDGVEIEIGLLIWLRHVLDAEAATRGKQRCFTSYAELMTSWNLVGQKVEDTLKVALPRLSPQVVGEVEDFLSAELRHQTVAAEKALSDWRTAGWVQPVFKIMERWVAEGESSADYSMLDQIREQFDGSSSVFNRPLRVMQNAQKEMKKLACESARWKEENDTLARELKSLRERDEAMAELEQRLQQREQNLAALTQADTAAKATVAELSEKIKALSETRDRQHTALQEARAERDRVAEERKQLATRLQALTTNKTELEERLKATESGHEKRVAELTAELAAIRGALDERRLSASKSESLLAEMRNQMIERETAHERNRIAQENELDRVRREAEAELNALRDEVSWRVEAVEQEKSALHETLAERESDLAQLRSALEQRRHELEQDSETIARLQAERDALQATLQSAETKASEREATLIGQVQERDSSLRNIERSLDERNREFTLLTELVVTQERERRQEVEALRRQATELQATLQSAETKAREREATLIGQVQERDSSLRNIERSLDERNREFTLLTELVVTRERERSEEVEALRRQATGIQTDRDAHKAYIAELLASRSWKVTRPLRSVTTVMRRVLGRD